MSDDVELELAKRRLAALETEQVRLNHDLAKVGKRLSTIAYEKLSLMTKIAKLGRDSDVIEEPEF